MNGVSSSQLVFGTHNGSQGSFSMSELMAAYMDDPNRLPEYQVYVMTSPDKPCQLVTPGSVIDCGSYDAMRLTAETGETLVIPVSGLMYDIAEFNPVHYTVNYPGNAKYFVGYYGNVQPSIQRRIAKYEFIGSVSIMKLDLPNFLTNAYAVVLSE